MTLPVAGLVSVSALLSSERMSHLKLLQRPERDAVIDRIVVVGDPEDIMTTRPNALLLLSESAAAGGWMISTAVRYAWERRAAVLVVPDRDLSASVLGLAARFQVGVVATDQGIIETALLLAQELGALQAGTLARLDRVGRDVRSAADPRAVLAVLAADLDASSVVLDAAGVTIAAAHGTTPSGQDQVVAIDIPGAHGDPMARLSVAVMPVGVEYARQALSQAAPVICAQLLAAEVRGSAAAFPLLNVAAMTTRGGGPVGGLDASPEVVERLLIREGVPYLAVALRETDQHDRSEAAAQVVRQRWVGAFGDAPIGRVAGGWIAVVPHVHKRKSARAVTALTEMTPMLAQVGMALGISSTFQRSTDVTKALAEAWTAARLADVGGGVATFDQINEALIPALVPTDLAGQLAGVLYPDLLADPQAADLVAAVVAYLDCAGSVTDAAHLLGVHRNTLQLRLRTAAKRGVLLDKPAHTLGLHLVLAAAQRGRVWQHDLSTHPTEEEKE